MTFDRKWKVQLPLALGLSLISGYSVTLSANADESTAPSQTTSTQIAIRNIYLNDNKQLIVEFDNPAHLSMPSPEVRDYPGQQHDIVLEFTQTSFAIDKAPKAKILLDQLMKVYPAINSIAYASANDGTKARIRIGLSPQTASHPTLVNVSEDSAVISLDLSEMTNPMVASKDTNNNVANSASTQSKVAAAPTSVASSETGAATKPISKVNKLAKLGNKINPLGKFGFGKKNNQASTPTSIASTASPAKPDAAPITTNTNAEEQKTAQAPAETSTQPPQIAEAPPEAAKTTASANNTAPIATTAPENKLNSVSPLANVVSPNPDTATKLPSISESITSVPTVAIPAQIQAPAEVSVSPPALTEIPKPEPSQLVQPIKSDSVTASTNLSALKPEIKESITSVPTSTAVAQVPAETPVSTVSLAEIAKPEQSTAQPPQSIKAADVTALANSSTLKSEIKEPTSEAVPVSDSNTAQPISPIETLAIDNGQPSLPRIPTTAEGSIADKVSNESLITPLSVEQVLKEKAVLSAQAAQNPQPSAASTSAGEIISTKESSGDKTIADDLKTSFDQPKTEAKVESAENKEELADKDKDKDKDKKDEPEKIASISAGNTLDSLTNAAIKNKTEAETDTQNTTPHAPVGEAIKLKEQKAHIGGKDYLPPKFADDAVDHYNAAVQFHLNGKLTEAATEYQAAVEADPKIAEAYSNLGLIYNQQRKYDQAMDQFHKALMINPKDAITYNGIGAALRAQNNMIAAIKNWKTAITLDPNLASAHYNLGTAYELQKDYDKALGEYKEAIKHDDKLGEAYYRMGLILQKMDNKNLALQEYKNAVKISQQATYVPDAKRRINLLSQTKSQSM